jgi:RNA polymerase sigma factor (TIGR02999 family)
MKPVTLILRAIQEGDPHAAGQLLPLVYDELRRLAAQKLAHEKPGQTLDATALVHEAYLRLADGDGDMHWQSRGHFFAAAAEAIRRILIENARRRRSCKHGGGLVRHDVEELPLADAEPSDKLLAPDEALTRLAEKNAAKAELVRLHYPERRAIGGNHWKHGGHPLQNKAVQFPLICQRILGAPPCRPIRRASRTFFRSVRRSS